MSCVGASHRGAANPQEVAQMMPPSVVLPESEELPELRAEQLARLQSGRSEKSR